jgi:hypothetical protein
MQSSDIVRLDGAGGARLNEPLTEWNGTFRNASSQYKNNGQSPVRAGCPICAITNQIFILAAMRPRVGMWVI